MPTKCGGLIPDPESTDPWDAGGLLDALGSESEVTAPAVRAALEAAGVPHGAPLVLAGYSQGGVHAVNLAGREDFIIETLLSVRARLSLVHHKSMVR